MDTGLLTSDNIYDAETGQFISATQQRTAELIAEYNEDLRVVWIPPADRVAGGPKPFGVAHFPKTGEPYVIFFVSEEEMVTPHLVLQKLIQADQGRGSNNNIFARMAAEEAARTLANEKAKRDAMEEMHDRALSMFRSPKHTYQLGDGRRVDL